MGRASILGVKDVEEAVQLLKNAGKPINPYQVRKITGGGSEAKIAYHLKALGYDANYDTDKELTNKLLNLIRPLVLEMGEDTSQLIIEAKREMQTRIDKQLISINELSSEKTEIENLLLIEKDQAENLKEQVTQYTEKCHRYALKLERLDEKIKGQEDINKQLKADVARLKTELKQSDKQQEFLVKAHKKEKEEVTANYRIDIKNAQMVSEAYRAEIKQRSNNELTLQRKIDEIQNNLSTTKDSLSIKNTEFKVLENDLHHKSVNYENEITQLKKQLNSRQKELEKSLNKIEKLEKLNQKYINKDKRKNDNRKS